MSALLTYRSRNSFESRFGRNPPDPSRQQNINGRSQRPPMSGPNEHWAIHNDGHMPSRPSSRSTSSAALAQVNGTGAVDPQFSSSSTIPVSTSTSASVAEGKRLPISFDVKGYLRYQRQKFVGRFDSNCYIAITRKLDTHDVSRHRVDPQSPTRIADALAMIQQPTLIIGIESDGLFTFAEQQELAAGIPNARLRTIDSPEGHDAFLLQFEQVNHHILEFLKDILPDIMEAPPQQVDDGGESDQASGQGLSNNQLNGDHSIGTTSNSLFGEAEATEAVDDITAW